MSFSYQNIKGAVVEKPEMDFYGESTLPHNHTSEDMGFCEAADAQSSVRLRFNREKLAEVINQALIKRTELKDKMFENVAKRPKLPLLQEFIADAIIASDKDIVELDQ